MRLFFGKCTYKYLTNIKKLAYLYFFKIKTFHAWTKLVLPLFTYSVISRQIHDLATSLLKFDFIRSFFSPQSSAHLGYFCIV